MPAYGQVTPMLKAFAALMTTFRRGGRSPAAFALVLIVLVCVAICGLTAWRVVEARAVDVRNSQIANRNLARALGDHAHATFEIAGMTLAGLVERAGTDGAAPAALARLHDVMREKTGPMSRVRDLFLFDAAGKVLATSLPQPPAATAVDRAFFQWHRDNAGDGLYFGPPVKGRHNDRWTLIVSRRVNDADGGFAGVVVATIDAELFSGFYASFDVGPNGSIALIAEDSTLMVRHPPLPEKIGITNPAFLWSALDKEPSGDRVVTSPLDGVLRYSSFLKIDRFPFMIFVSRSEADVLRQWRQNSIIVACASAAVVLALAVLGWRLAQQIRQRQRAEAGLARSEQRYRLLADTSTDLIIHADPAHRRLYVSPASKGLLGYDPDEMMAMDPHDTVHPDDAAALTRHFAAVVEGHGSDTANFRMRHKDGRYIWVEAVARNIGGDQGSVVVIRDITARKAAEAQLHAANNQLQRIALQDGLTGIANRRSFDLALQNETRRCTRAELPLAALLVDVDHFKAYNDTYGHSAGDECLVAIAKALNGATRRPADFIARYGGEEFIILLPETDQEGALHFARNLMDAIDQLAIPHEQGVAGMVTVSIGVAAIWPGPSGPPARALIDAADAALYGAKRTGRARVQLGQVSVEPTSQTEATVDVSLV